MNIHTFGYHGRDMSELEAATLKGYMIADIRQSPRSRNSEWDGIKLAQRLGDRYRHIAGFGNLNYLAGGPAKFADFAAGLRQLKELSNLTNDVILLCGCESEAKCHRLALANRLNLLSGFLYQGELPRAEPTFADEWDDFRALTVLNPWAHAIVHLGKDCENRPIPPPAKLVGRRFAIHAGKRLMNSDDDMDYFEEVTGKPFPALDDMTFSAIVAVATIDRVAMTKKQAGNSKWYEAPSFGIMLKDVTPVGPFPVGGMQSYWRVDRELVAKIRAEYLQTSLIH